MILRISEKIYKWLENVLWANKTQAKNIDLKRDTNYNLENFRISQQNNNLHSQNQICELLTRCATPHWKSLRCIKIALPNFERQRFRRCEVYLRYDPALFRAKRREKKEDISFFYKKSGIRAS